MKNELPPIPEPLPRPVVDSHCHLDTAEEVVGHDPERALQQAASVNITKVVQVGCDLAGSRWALQATDRFDQVVATVALHPNDAARMGDELGDGLAEIESMLSTARREGNDRLRGVGETGLDYFRTPDAALQELQQKSFLTHIELAKAYDKTLVIHDRDAHDDIADLLDQAGWPDRVVFHCFSGDADFARRCLAHDAWLSFPGPVTYKANKHLREALVAAPLEKILTETDAPYLVPEPHRGLANASYLVPHTVRFIADTRGEDLDTVCDALTGNAFDAFGGAW